MIRFDNTEFEFAGPGGWLTGFIRAEKDGKRPLDWMVEGRLSATQGPIRRGDFGGVRFLDFFLSTFGGSASHLDELPGQIDERTENWQISKAVMLMPVADAAAPEAINGRNFGMSLRHHFKLGPRRGYHFLVEGEAVFLPFNEAASVVFGGTDAINEELQTVSQIFAVLEHVPLAALNVVVAHDLPNRIDVARALAADAGFEDLELWPGRTPDYVPFSSAKKGERDAPSGMVQFVTPWARHTDA